MDCKFFPKASEFYMFENGPICGKKRRKGNVSYATIRASKYGVVLLDRDVQEIKI